jgi:uncharacterized protein
MTGVRVRENESIESAIRRFKKLCEKAGILAELRKREHYEKPSVKRKKKAIAAKKRALRRVRHSFQKPDVDLKADIKEAVKVAMKSGDAVTLSTLRLLLAALQNEEIRLRRELVPEEIQRSIATLGKQRTEAIDLYRKGRRDDLAQKEEAELVVLKRFLPQPLSEDEVKSLIRVSIAEASAKGIQDLGKVMKLVMPKVAGRSDGKRVNELAKALLGD